MTKKNIILSIIDTNKKIIGILKVYKKRPDLINRKIKNELKRLINNKSIYIKNLSN